MDKIRVGSFNNLSNSDKETLMRPKEVVSPFREPFTPQEIMAEMQNSLNEASDRIEELIEALKFYANANNYERPFRYSVEIPSNIQRDQGELARLILWRHNG